MLVDGGALLDLYCEAETRQLFLESVGFATRRTIDGGGGTIAYYLWWIVLIKARRKGF
jgi:hypothetical protein